MICLQRRIGGTHHEDGSLPDQGVVDLALVHNGGGQDAAPADDGLVHVEDGDWAVGGSELQVGFVEVTQTCQLLCTGGLSRAEARKVVCMS